MPQNVAERSRSKWSPYGSKNYTRPNNQRKSRVSLPLGGSVIVKDPVTGNKSRQQKQHYYVISIREIHNELIKPANDGGLLVLVMPMNHPRQYTVLKSQKQTRLVNMMSQADAWL
jgi:hypothetical protein